MQWNKHLLEDPPIMRGRPGVQQSLKTVCSLKTLIRILLQTEKIPHQHGYMFNAQVSIISSSQFTSKHFSEKESPLFALEVKTS